MSEGFGLLGVGPICPDCEEADDCAPSVFFIAGDVYIMFVRRFLTLALYALL